jgi:hypothetical protein
VQNQQKDSFLFFLLIFALFASLKNRKFIIWSATTKSDAVRKFEI